MAERFSFDAEPVGGVSGSTNGIDNGEAGSGTGESGTSTDNNRVAGEGDNARGEVGNGGGAGAAFDPDAPLGRKADGTPRKRRPKGYRGTSDNGTASSADQRGKARLAVVNDREKVKQNIGGLHLMAAMLLKQNVLILQENEASKLANALCDVADYHNYDILGVGGASVLYISLASVAYAIYVPRMVAIKMGQGNGPITQEKGNGADNEEWPMRPSEASTRASNDAGTMNYKEEPVKFN